MTKERQLKAKILLLEMAMAEMGVWQSTPPSEEALSSQQPFALDTLQPHEWLQWVFITRMKAILESNQPIPTGFSLAPYFEECWKESPHFLPLLDKIKAVDEVCS